VTSIGLREQTQETEPPKRPGKGFETPPPFEKGMFKPLPPTGARTLDSRTAFYYAGFRQ
jgi:hypothetical protein